MKALVLAAGRGSRLGAAAGGVPKPLTELAGTSPLEHVLTWVSQDARDGIWINVHQSAALVRQRIGAAVNGVPVSFSYEPELLGTAGAWKKLEHEWTETSLVAYGDNFMRFDLSALRATHERAGALLTLAIFDPAVHANTGVGGGRVRLEGARVTRFVEGGTDGPISAGVYLIEPELAVRLRAGFLDFGHDVMPALATEGRLAGHVVEEGGYCLGLDTPERLELARRMVQAMEVGA